MNVSEIEDLIQLIRRLLKEIPINDLIDNLHENIFEKYIEEYNINLLENRYYLEKNDKRELFLLITKLSKQLLTVRNQVPVCKYEYLMQWRKYTISLEDDLLIVANLVDKSSYYGNKEKNFNWRLVIDHDNEELNKILQMGISDNHYHLWGSIPLFKHAWIYFMNNVDKDIDFDFLGKSNKIPVLLIKAALIRIYFFDLLNQETDDNNEYKINKNQQQVINLLKNEKKLLKKRAQIQEAINSEKKYKLFIDKKAEYYDYIFFNKNDFCDIEVYKYSSERKFLYSIIFKIMKSTDVNIECINLLHIYLAIKEKVREIMMQSITNTGFKDFYKINTNKNAIINLYNNPKDLLYPHIKNEILSDNITRVEIKIKIQETAYQMAKYIKQLDELIDPEENCRNTIKYIICFSRKNDKLENDKELYRDFNKRISIEKQSAILKDFFMKYNTISKRVVGVDVCSSELNYKPEVYSDLFNKNNIIFNNNIKRTYHVGEEFNDFFDGLRSIDECINFLNLREGDRLGHALPLGIDIYSFYKRKDYLINTSKEQYLDNIVWVYFKLKNRKKYKEVLDSILKEFHEYFMNIYEKNFDINILKEFREIVGNNELSKKFESIEKDVFTIEDYHYAWKLRKKNPQTIMKSFLNNINRFNNRKKLKSLFIAINYFYNSRIKLFGTEEICININEAMLEVIHEIQKQIQYEVKENGINVEICPSSNVMTGNVEDYSQHPLANIYSEGLQSRNKSINSPQIPISINTDDKSIFCTSLKNEYSLIANAFEMKIDENFNKVYDKQSVYKWIDNIRKNGLKMNF